MRWKTICRTNATPQLISVATLPYKMKKVAILLYYEYAITIISTGRHSRIGLRIARNCLCRQYQQQIITKAARTTAIKVK